MGGFSVKQRGPECRRDPGINDLADALKALSDANRLRVMCFLSAGERCVCEVESELGISQQLASHHLNVLKDAGLLILRKEGTWSYYSIDVNNLKRANQQFMKYLDFTKVISQAASTTCCS
jgi:DNA-binding transcriptional ArsR family regulator